MQNEILKPVLATDETAIPRYDIVNPDGSVSQQNVELRLKNEVMQQGTPYDEESVLPATLRAKLGLPNSATPANAFEAVLAKAGAKVSMNEPTSQDNIAAGYSIGAMWIRPRYTLYNLAYSKLAEDFNASACLVSKDGQSVTATGNGNDKVISVTLEHSSATGWLYCVVTPDATAVSAKLIAGTEEVALTVGEANVIKHKYSGTSITFEATYATANDANTSTIVIDNLTVIDEAATLEQVDDGYRDITNITAWNEIANFAPFDTHEVTAQNWQHIKNGTWNNVLDTFAWIMQYCWKRRTLQTSIRVSEAKNCNVHYAAAGDDVLSRTSVVKYSSEVKYNHSTNKVELAGDIKEFTISFNQYTNANILKGKYWGPSNTQVYFTPEDAADATREKNSHNNEPNGWWWARVDIYAETHVYNEITGDWEYLVSPSRVAYPDYAVIDGYEYVYHGQTSDRLLKTPKMVSGSYMGTGLYGQLNPNILTFDFEPRLLIMPCYENGVTGEVTNLFANLWVIDSEVLTTLYKVNSGFSIEPNKTYAKISEDHKTVYWYNTTDADKQLNLATNVYRYIAIG